jgi:HEXXH motif-containing protein
LLACHHQRTAADVLSLIGSVAPLSAPDGVVRSLTARHIFGSIALSLPGDDVTMALILCHEVQHAKLAALMDLVPLATESAPGLFYAPWRPDPRPLASLLQGAYAHLGVVRFWRRHRHLPVPSIEIHQANVEFARWRNASIQVAQTIRARPELTRCGVVFVDEMLRVLRRWQHEYVPPKAQEEADHAASEHRKKWSLHPGGESEMPAGDGPPSSP